MIKFFDRYKPNSKSFFIHSFAKRETSLYFQFQQRNKPFFSFIFYNSNQQTNFTFDNWKTINFFKTFAFSNRFRSRLFLSFSQSQISTIIFINFPFFIIFNLNFHLKSTQREKISQFFLNKIFQVFSPFFLFSTLIFNQNLRSEKKYLNFFKTKYHKFKYWNVFFEVIRYSFFN